jgi:predicted CXXCH cytochrome family protein
LQIEIHDCGEHFMSDPTRPRTRQGILAFGITFGICLVLGVALAYSSPASAAPAAQTATPPAPTTEVEGDYRGPDLCKACHEDVHEDWSATRHAAAFSSPIFQENWTKNPEQNSCLQCHTTGYNAADGSYKFEGVTCESCHGPYQTGHPQVKMPITPDATLCATCHKTTSDEWRASKHGETGIQCQACHNPHTQAPKADSVNALCGNCHKEPGQTFTHGTHANAGLQCSNCHMYTTPANASPVGGLVATGHTFVVGSETCIGCHKDTVHTRDKIVSLTGEVTQLTDLDVEALRQKAQSQEQEIASLKASSDTRLYVGLAQGALVGLATGGVAAWIVSRRIRVITEIVEEGGQEQAKGGKHEPEK